jgi:metal-dependent amidase/aminoacylase/carboxypeptidase family protein
VCASNCATNWRGRWRWRAPWAATYELKLKPGYPSMYNDPAVAEVIRAATTRLASADALDRGHPP